MKVYFQSEPYNKTRDIGSWHIRLLQSYKLQAITPSLRMREVPGSIFKSSFVFTILFLSSNVSFFVSCVLCSRVTEIPEFLF